MSFTTFGLNPALLRGLDSLGFTDPTPIQRDAIPPALEGRDLIACAMTGSGKTAAFGLPMLHHLSKGGSGRTRALVLAPTRELAAQVAEHLQLLGKHTPVRVAAVFGGVAQGPQEQAFRQGTDVIVATPGRLLDHLSRPHASLAHVEYLVIDEADRMMDMGFLPDVRRILRQVPAARQTLLFSATLPPPIVQLSSEVLKRPVTLNIDRQVAPATGITHSAYSVPQTSKSHLLVHLLEDEAMDSVVVFTRTKHRANRLAQFFEKQGVSCARIHGNRSQSQRTLALSGFKKRQFRVLVATDIAARGIDVEAISHVINFDVPPVAEDYVHRVGRTARAEATGKAITFVAPDEEEAFRGIERALGSPIPRSSVPRDLPALASQIQPEVPRQGTRRQSTGSRPAAQPRPVSSTPTRPTRRRLEEPRTETRSLPSVLAVQSAGTQERPDRAKSDHRNLSHAPTVSRPRAEGRPAQPHAPKGQEAPKPKPGRARVSGHHVSPLAASHLKNL
ncbi:MAG TPA: DEAD/DEAH box helicase [Armatimonadota bacterium]|jgi:ATP-dependent RNA helicase RhlE